MTQKQQKQQEALKSLSIRGYVYNFFLLHDFFYRITKIKSPTAQFFDMQFDVTNSMVQAAKTGGKTGQIAAFGGLVWYFLKGNSLKLRFLFGILYGYWINHFYTLGSYAGVLITLPGVYKRTCDYFNLYPTQHNYILDLNKYLDSDLQDTKAIMDQIFPLQLLNQNYYVQNSYFIANKQKYNINDKMLDHPTNKLPYLDCFLSRYIYFSFARWFSRLRLFIGVKQQ